MIRDGLAWALGSMAITAVEPDPSLVGFVRNAGVIGSIVAAGWLVEARIGKKINGAITSHTQIEDERLGRVRAEISGELGKLVVKLDGLHEKLDARPCAVKCGHHRGE